MIHSTTWLGNGYLLASVVCGKRVRVRKSGMEDLAKNAVRQRRRDRGPRARPQSGHCDGPPVGGVGGPVRWCAGGISAFPPRACTLYLACWGGVQRCTVLLGLTFLVDGSRAPRSTPHMIFECWSAPAPLP